MNFERCLQITLKFEGGWSDDSADPGGQTMRGITQHTYDSTRLAAGRATRSVRDIADDEIAAIYREQYWSAAGCDDWAWPLCAAVFDLAVNAGVPRATRTLQTLVGVLADGVLGMTTRGAVAAQPPAGLAKRLISARRDYYRAIARSNPPLAKFLEGWLKRCDQLSAQIGVG